MDVNLPKLDGVEATKLIKAQRPSTVVIGLSVHQENQIQHVLKEAGAAAYLTKDAAADSLYGAVIAAVGDKSTRRAGDNGGRSFSQGDSHNGLARRASASPQ